MSGYGGCNRRRSRALNRRLLSDHCRNDDGRTKGRPLPKSGAGATRRRLSAPRVFVRPTSTNRR